ncbi:MAG: hypothetical protein MI861_05745, partial [Pirellulales bacterium]|nr:hypothetical protein [Pirellulales bacterium]
MPAQITRIVFVSLAMLWGGWSWGQDNPLDGPPVNGPDPDIFQGLLEDPEPEQPTAEEEPVSPIVKQLNEHARRGNLPMAEAVSSLARIGRWKDVDRILSAAAARNIEAGELAAMAGRIEPAVMLRISSREEISDPARAILDKISSAAIAQAQSPDRLRRAIDGLDDPSEDLKLASARTLLRGGNAAIAEMVAAIVSAQPSAPRDEILPVMLRLGPGGELALRQLAIYGTPQVRQKAVEALARIHRSSAVNELIVAIYASDSSPQEVAAATAIWQQAATTLPSREQTLSHLHRQLKKLQQAAKIIPNDDHTALAWTISSDRSRATYHVTQALLLAYRDVADMAIRLRRVGGYSQQIATDVLIADLSYRLMVDPDWGDPDQVQSMREAYGAQVRGDALLRAIDRSSRQHDLPALVGLLRLVDLEASESERSVLLRSSGPLPTALVAAASRPEPRIRYEAAITVARLAGQSPYGGSS